MKIWLEQLQTVELGDDWQQYRGNVPATLAFSMIDSMSRDANRCELRVSLRTCVTVDGPAALIELLLS